jgi:hypothetical protein
MMNPNTSLSSRVELSDKNLALRTCSTVLPVRIGLSDSAN